MDAASPAQKNTTSKTVTDTIVGEAAVSCRALIWLHGPLIPYPCFTGGHTHTIVGYSLIKGIGDGEPIASDRFTVGGHEWVSAG